MKFTKPLLYFILFLTLSTSHAFAVEEKYVYKVQNLIEAFKSRNKAVIAKMVSYPLTIESNRAEIKNEYEFISRFEEIFDQNLLKSIITSDARTDWNTVGWRGFMLFDGDVWLDHNGSILSVTSASIYAENQPVQNTPNMSARGRSALHRSVYSYAQPVLEWKTNRYHVRVDDIGNGSLRYASWPVNSGTIVKPDIVLTNGLMVVDKSGRNRQYVFNNGNFSYHLKVNAHGDRATRSLEVYKGNKRYFTDAVREIIR